MDDFKAGDIVICINDTPAPNAPPPGVTKGAVYRVVSVEIADDVDESLLLDVGLPPCENENAIWLPGADRFKKIPPASDEFINQLSKFLPRREPIDA